MVLVYSFVLIYPDQGWNLFSNSFALTRVETQIYDIGTEILYQTCFGHNSTQKASPEELQVRIFTKFSVDSKSAIKTRCSKIGIFAKKAPAGIIREPFYKIFQKKSPCGHIKWALLQNISKKSPCGHIKWALLQHIQKKGPLRAY